MLRSRRFFVILIPLALAACSSQADTSYRGQPLAELHGTVEESLQTPADVVPPLAVTLAWNGELPGSDAKSTVAQPETDTAVPVSGQFPASFTLQVYAPPPAAALLACSPGAPDSPHIATAEIEAVAQSGDAAAWGAVVTYELVYADADLAASNPCFPFALTAGYHLGAFTRGPDLAGCTPAAPDDPTCWGPLAFQEIPITTSLTLQLQASDAASLDGGATPPPPLDAGPTPTPPADGGTTTDAGQAQP